MIHDRTASVVSLARTVLAGLDQSRLETPVQTSILKLLLETLVDLGAPAHHHRMAENNAKTVMGHTMSISKAQEAAQKVFEAEAMALESAVLVTQARRG